MRGGFVGAGDQRFPGMVRGVLGDLILLGLDAARDRHTPSSRPRRARATARRHHEARVSLAPA